MAIDPYEFAQARLALSTAVRNNLFDRERLINLVDIGLYERDGQIENRLAIRFHVDRFIPAPHLESTGRIPLHDRPIMDIPTIVIEGRYRLKQWNNWWSWWNPTPRTTRADPLKGGIGISTDFYGTGTLGAIVRDRQSLEPMVLSNWHVLVVYWGARRGQLILQPGRQEGGTWSDTIASLERDAMSQNLDAAVALLNKSRRLSSEQTGIGLVTGASRPILGMELEKSGFASGKTDGIVTGIAGELRMTYQSVERVIRDVITIDAPQGLISQISISGDSGSVWVEKTTKKAIGLHFAGYDTPGVRDRALALDMQAVIDALNVDFFV